jgi:hypothetical protein
LSNITRIPDGAGGPALLIDERKLLHEAMNTPYAGTNAARQGLSKMAAAALTVADKASEGDPWAITFVFDRLYGKAKAVIESTHVTATLKDYLKYLDTKRREERVIVSSPVEAIDAELAGN